MNLRTFSRTLGPAFFCPALLLALLISGCHSDTLPTPANEEARAQQQAVIDSQREQLNEIPPPSKNLYMAVRSLDNWQNPYLTTQANMLTLHILLADANTTDYGAGGLLRPIGARRQTLDISLDKLGEAISSIPESSWPYGRVIALEEAHKTPSSAEPAVRRTMEQAIRTLNNLGVVVYDMNERNLR